MSFDARSLERLQQLGRTLPQPLPQPPAPAPANQAAPASAKRHRVETETDPEALFRELMHVSPDGSVPPHLMDRLRQAEADAAARRRPPAASSPAAANRERQPRRSNALNPQGNSETQELYVAFQHLLLEDEEDG